ncbi:phage tail tape measure protein [Mediterraneibacter faecis]|uniref:phage tail tape measure protein n=1 Tax=Mediterraneibacter faecis TaxID=592978 RepID=UPI003F9B1DD1
MSQDFKINVDTDLNTAEAEQKLNALLKEKHKLTIDVDVSGQNTAKKLKQNIENGLKNVKIDTSAMSKSLADSFNITDKSTISKLQKQLNSMMTSLGKSWNGQKFNLGDGFETSMTSVVNTLKKNAKTLRSSGAFDDFYNYFKNQKILVTDALKKELGDSNYKSLLNQNIGKLVTDTKKSTATINSMWSELNGKFPNLFPDNITNQADQLNHALSVWKQAQADIKKISAENMNVFEAGNVDSRAWDSVINMASKMESALKTSISEATEIGKTTIDLDVQINTENITSQIREAINSASLSSGEALDLNLKINDEQLVSNLRSAISKIAMGDEPVKVDIDVDKNGLQEKLNAACHDMEIPVDFKIDSEDIASKIKAAVNQITDIELDLSVNTDSVKKAVDDSINIDPDIDSSGITQLQNALQGVNNAGRQTQNIFSSIGGSVKEAFSSMYNISNLLQDGMYKVAEAGQKAVETVKEFNDIKTNLAMATNADSTYIDNLMNDYNSLAQELGSLTSSVAESADSFLRQGRSMADTNSLIKDSLVLSKDAELSPTDASEILTATLNGFQMAADQASKVNDILTSIDLESASGADSIGTALMKVASQANNAGVSLEKTSAIIATIKDVTQDSDESIGTAMKSILSRMNQIKAGKFVDAETGESLNDTEKVLKKIGVSMRDNTGMFRDSEGVLDDIAKKWKTLDSNSQKAVATATAGTYQYNKFIAAMDNWDKVEKLTDVAYNSEGTAQKKFEDNYLNSLEAKTNQLKSSLEGLSTSLISDDMYAGFLDGSKAIVDFVDKTNLLKGALAGLGTFGGAFVFKNLTSMIQGTVREFSNLGNAINFVKSGTIDTKGFKELLNLTQGLSESQMQLVLSSTSLSDAQRVQLLTNSGVAQAEAEATVAAMGLSTANGAATASTVSFSSALEGLFATMMANPIILLTAAVSAGVMVWQSYKQSVEDAVNSASTAGQKFSENTSSLNEQISKVEELRESIASGVLSDEEAYNAKSQLLDIQNQLASTYGESASSIDLVNGKMEEQIALMQQLQVEDAKKTLNENKTGFDKIKSEMTKTRKSGIAQFNGGSKDAEAVAEIAKNYVDKGLSLQKDSTGAYTITFKGDVTQAESILNSFMNDVQNRIDTVGDNNGILEGVIDSTSSELSKFKGIIDEYGDDYNNFLQADIISKGLDAGSPAAILEDYKQAVDDYNDALSSGDTSAIDRAKNSFDVMSSTVDGVLDKFPQYKTLFDEVGESLNTTAINTNNFQNALKSDNYKNIVKDFKDLQDVDLKGISFDDDELMKGESALRLVVDKAIELGVVSDDDAESVSKVVDILTEMGLTGSVSVSNLTESFSEAQTSIQQAEKNVASLKSMLSESVSGSGMSADSVKSFKEMFGDDADKALEKTANGYHLNQKALAQLQEQQKQSTKTDYLGSLADQQEALRKVEESISKGLLAGQDVSAYATQRDSIKQNIETLQDLAYQYENALSAYNQWQAAMSGGEEGDIYDSIQGNLESAKELYDKGLTGTNKFREFVDLMSNQDLSTASNEEIVSAYESAMPKIKRYFTEGQEGAVNFLKDIQDINSEWAHMNDDGSWKIDFGVGNDQEIADKLGVDVEAVQAVMRKLKDYGFDINLDQPVQSLDELKTSAESAKESLVDMNETSFNGINLDSSSFSEVTDEIEKVQSYIETIQEDSEIDPDVKTEKLQHANEILEYLVQKQQELGQSDIEITVNADELESKINDAKSALGEFKNEGGTVDISLSGAQDAVDNLQTLLYQKETLTNTSAVMSIDTSQVDGEIGEAIALLQEYQTAVNNLNAQNELGKAGVDIDTTEAQQKVQDLASKIQGLDGNTKASLSLDTSEVQSALTTLTETKVNVNAGVNLDTAALGTIQSSISAITPQMLVNAKVDKTLVDGYDPKDKDAKVKFTAEHSDVDAYKPSNKNAKVNYTVHVSGLENLPGNKERNLTYNVKTNGSVSPANGTAHSIGTAHAAGTTNASANKNWGLKRNEPHALVNELKPEIIVRDGQPFIVNGGDPAFTSLKQGDIVFNGEQSEALLKNGYVTGSHGKLAYEGAHSLGTAFSNGTGKFNVGSSGSKSSSSSKKKSSSSSSSSRNSGSSSSSSSSSNSSSSSANDASEKVIDWIETLLSRVKRITDLAVNSIDRAIGLVNKQVKAADAISKVQAEIGANQEAAQAYLDKANSINLSDVYKEKIMNGELTVETINDETLQKNIEDYKSYYESYLSAMDNVLDLEDKLTDLAEKRLSIIEDQYDAIGDLKEAIKSGQEENRTLLENLGTSINSDANKNSLKQSITAQSQLYSSLTKKLEAYEAEVESQLKSGLMKKGSEQWYNAQKNIQEFATNITKASSELIELQDKLRQIQYDVLQNSIDSYARQTNKMNTYIDLLGAQDRQVPENLYQQQIKLNNNQIAKQYNLRAKYKKEQEKYDVNSKRYQELAEKINDADIEILNLRKDNEELKDSIFELRFTNIDKAIQKYSDLEDELSNFRDLLNDDAFVDKQGGITDEGLANIALLSQSIGNAKQKIADYTTGLTKLYEAYKNGTISADEYNEKAQEYRKGIQEATKDVKSYQNSLTDLYMKAMQTEIDYLGKIIDKRKKALSQQKEAYEFSKKVNSQSKDINSLKAQYEAIKNSNNLADKAKAKQLAAQIKEKEEELADTKRDHEYDMRSQGYDKMSDELSELLENTEYEISHNADKQLEIINSMLDKEVASYEAAYAKINSIIRETGFNGSSDFRNEQKELSTEQGAQNQKNEATQYQVSANKKPSSAASGTKTDKIYEGKSQNDKITQEILKPEETKRKVAELAVDKTSVSLEEGKSIGIKTSVRPNDAANKTLSWTSSNTSIATASNGTIKAIKPGSCTITVATTDGGGISKTIGVTVTKKPEPAKPAKKPTASTSNGKDGILRVGDTATLSGRYYYDSWGKRPAGSKYSGVQNGVKVDSYSSSDLGGNAKRTGNYKVHIGGADGVYKDLGWVRPDQLSGYKNGIERVPYDQVAEINEGNKDETIITPKGHTLTLLTRNSSVLKNEAQKTLWDIANNPQLFAEKIMNSGFASAHVGSFADSIKSIKMPTVENNNQQNVTVENHYDSLLTVNGSVDKEALPKLQEIIKQSYEYTRKEMVKDFEKLGHKIKR